MVGFIAGLFVGAIIGVVLMALCVAASRSDRIVTNADKLAHDTDQLVDLIYRSDDVGPDICQAECEGNDLVDCKYPDDDKGCVKCIKEWLNKEADTE